MKKISLPVKENEWLINALRRKNKQLRERNIKIKNCADIPPNVVLDKTLTGIGATYTEINAKRNSIIIEPNVPVIIGKAKIHPELRTVYGDITEVSIKKYFLNDEIQYKKLITTPEGFSKIRTVAKALGIPLYENYFCLFDECEKITEDVAYRNRITQPIYDFFKFKEKAFVSATPLKITHPEIIKSFRLLKVVPDFDYKQEIDLIVTNHFNKEFENQIEKLKDSKCVCIFFSSTQGINRIINNTIKSDYKVYCSYKSARQLRNRQIENVTYNFDTDFAKYNFFTSRYYSALDINLRIRPDIIICTDIYEKEHTVIDPFTEAIQIQGRFRKFINGKRYNSLTHIANIKQDMLAREEEAIMEEVRYYQSDYASKLNELKNEENVNIKRAIEKTIKQSPYYKLLDDNNEVNHFAIDNWIADERVKRYYTSKHDLERAYYDTNFFKPLTIYSKHDIAQVDSFKIKSKRSAKAIIKEIVFLLQELNDLGKIEIYRNSIRIDEGYAEQSKKYNVDTDVIIDAYLAMGSLIFEQSNFYFKKIEEQLDIWKQSERRFSDKVVIDILSEFQIGDKIDRNIVKDKLQETYNFHDITHKSFKVTNDTVKLYFNVSPHNASKPYSYVFKSILPEFEFFQKKF